MIKFEKMSYCRWSSDNFKCDIYAYQSGYGYEVHVASNRIIGDPPDTDITLIIGENRNIEEYLRQSKIRSEWMDKCERAKIGLPFDGESYTLPTPQEFYDKMIELREAGYHFPDYVLESIKEEITTP